MMMTMLLLSMRMVCSKFRIIIILLIESHLACCSTAMTKASWTLLFSASSSADDGHRSTSSSPSSSSLSSWSSMTMMIFDYDDSSWSNIILVKIFIKTDRNPPSLLPVRRFTLRQIVRDLMHWGGAEKICVNCIFLVLHCVCGWSLPCETSYAKASRWSPKSRRQPVRINFNQIIMKI